MPDKEKPKAKKIHDVVGVDFGSTSTKLVRVRKSGSSFTLVEADVMPPFDFHGEEPPRKLSLPKKLSAPYAAACMNGTRDQVRFMFISSKMHDAKSIRNRVGKSLGLDRNYRIGYSVVEKGADQTDHKVLASAMPKEDVKAVLALFAQHKPSLLSLEIAGLAALNSFSHVPEIREAEGAVCYLETGAESTMISFFIGGELRLVRKFEYGSIYIQQRIQDVLGIDEEEALGVLFEDATPLLENSLDPIGSLLQEISISKKFVERNENTVISQVYASGGLSYSPYWNHIMGEMMGAEIQVWNPFSPNGMHNCPKGVQGVESMFAPAIGAAIALISSS